MNGRDAVRLTAHGVVEERDAGHIVDRRRDQHAIHEIGERDLALAENHRRCAAAQVDLRVIGGVGSRHDDRHAGLPRAIDHLERGLAHAQQAHLAQVVEAVFVDGGDAGTGRARWPRSTRPRSPRASHRTVRRVAAFTQVRRRVQGAQRRVRLLRLPQLGIEAQVVRLAEQDVSHASPGFSPSASACDRPAGSRAASAAVRRSMPAAARRMTIGSCCQRGSRYGGGTMTPMPIAPSSVKPHPRLACRSRRR